MNTATSEILKMIKEEDEALCGCDWEEMYANEYDTPQTLINKLIDIWRNKTIMVDDEEDEDNFYGFYGFYGKELGTERDRIEALAIYLKEVADGLLVEAQKGCIK